MSDQDLFTSEEMRKIKRTINLMDGKLFRHEAPRLVHSFEIADYLKLRLSRTDKELFAAIFLDRSKRPISFEILFEGEISSTATNWRRIVNRCLVHDATAIILAHNHPSGRCMPTTADVYFTRELHLLLKQLDIVLLDHFIIGQGTPYSLADHRQF